jgi:hypothetical protein
MEPKRKSLLLRVDEDLWEELNQWASQEFRSVNGQIELILTRAIDNRKKRKRKTDINDEVAKLLLGSKEKTSA